MQPPNVEDLHSANSFQDLLVLADSIYHLYYATSCHYNLLKCSLHVHVTKPLTINKEARKASQQVETHKARCDRFIISDDVFKESLLHARDFGSNINLNEEHKSIR